MATEQGESSTGSSSNIRKSARILLLGDFETGKTSVIKTYLDLSDVSDENTFERFRARMKCNGNEVDFEICDLSPNSTAPERREFYPADVNAILLCFSVGTFESLKSVYNLWIHEARAHYGEPVPIFLVGLKSDLRHRPPAPVASSSQIRAGYQRIIRLRIREPYNPVENRMVERSEAENIHQKYRFHGEYMECSQHDRSSIVAVINKAFLAAVEY